MKSLPLALAFLAFSAVAANAQDAEVWDYWTAARMETLVKENGGKVAETKTEGGAIQMLTEWGQGNYATISGENCQGRAAQTQCRSALLSVSFGLGDAAKAKAAQDEVDLAFVAETVTDDGDYVVLRYVELGGGVNKENVRYNLMGFLELVGGIAEKILPRPAGG